MLPLRDNVPTSRTPYVTYVFIAANILVYFFWQKGGFSLNGPDSTAYLCQLNEWAAIPAEFSGDKQPLPTECGTDDAPTYATLFTAMFMHGGLLHLGGNMLFLWIFGNNVEDAMGPVKFVVFYLMGGIAAFALQFVTDTASVIPTVGASGAIAGVLGGYLLLYPRAKVVTVIFIVFFFTILELPALLVLGFWFLQQALMGYFDLADPTGGGGGVAYFAHIGGFVWGLLAIRLFASKQRTKRPPERLYTR
ncbi:rhomboid family intramembrane serine protease [Solirubrobacter sp. CPCC 204708]|uniref:Rhomboid family intramembrane serine protease n=1 Tax=Solirubrobacter deserti TaxID=2282478 RepID=A0ABT4RKG1_9ACTN|nr:rhomboid family intramembrane serine protease [Solirubrobacter deserti]MBE2316840.1 rhomboid family intramembrane serine protease [Solirubrobacter deserti]MDA0138943.1 rhomboid family intramembrane serine protease [Solirubrobacter deserti]